MFVPYETLLLNTQNASEDLSVLAGTGCVPAVADSEEGSHVIHALVIKTVTCFYLIFLRGVFEKSTGVSSGAEFNRKSFVSSIPCLNICFASISLAAGLL